jgi:murein L,D-transpeptidase YafK
MKNIIKLIISLLLTVNCAFAASYNVDEVRVYKTKHRMEMLFEGKVTKVYSVMLGRGGIGQKTQEGDKLVPEGKYTLDFKNPYSKFFRSIHINYPNRDDVERAKKLGVKPGGDIFIHGMPEFLFGELMLSLLDWTAGCVAISNSEMLEIWDNLDVPVTITIFH